jgi:hypothetical protein
MSVIQDLADQLAADVLAAEKELDDDRFYEKVSKVLLAASPTFQEAYITAIRVRLAERRGREFMERALAEKRSAEKAAASDPGPAAPAAAPSGNRIRGL